MTDNNFTEMKTFQTIRQTARSLQLPESVLRTWGKQGRLPGFQHGNRFYVDAPRLMADLRAGRMTD